MQLGNSEHQNREIVNAVLRLKEVVEPIKINLINGVIDDYSTYYDIGGGNKEFITQIPIRNSFAVQVVTASMAGTLDATLDIYGSLDKVNWALIAPTSFSRITLSTNGTNGWTKDLANYDFLKITLTVNNCTGGRLNLLMTLK